MTFDDFYEIAKYMNEQNKNMFSEDEILDGANEYWYEFIWSRENGEMSYNIKILCEQLEENFANYPADKRPKNWADKIKKEINLKA